MSNRYKIKKRCAKLLWKVISLLDINIEFFKGILFIRLTGVLNKNTVDKLKIEVNNLVKENGIRNTVFNVSGLDSIDCYGINTLLNNYEIILKIYSLEFLVFSERLFELHSLSYSLHLILYSICFVKYL